MPFASCHSHALAGGTQRTPESSAWVHLPLSGVLEAQFWKYTASAAHDELSQIGVAAGPGPKLANDDAVVPSKPSERHTAFAPKLFFLNSFEHSVPHSAPSCGRTSMRPSRGDVPPTRRSENCEVSTGVMEAAAGSAQKKKKASAARGLMHALLGIATGGACGKKCLQTRASAMTALAYTHMRARMPSVSGRVGPYTLLTDIMCR